MDLRNLHGILAFLPTPFTADGALDAVAVEHQVDYLAASGVGAVVVSGGVGEFYSLDAVEHRELVAGAVSAAGDRVPIVAGVGHSSAIAAELGRRSAAEGAAALMVNPLYFVRPELRGVVEHYRQIGAAAELPLIVFSTEGAVYGPDELEALAEVPEVSAYKDEVGDLALFSRCRAQLGDRYTWINGMAEPLAMQYAAAGATAITSGLVNLDAALTTEIWAAACAGDQDRYDVLMVRAEPLLALRRKRPGYHTTVLKEGMALLGRTTGHVRLPLMPLLDDERAALQAMLTTAPATPRG